MYRIAKSDLTGHILFLLLHRKLIVDSDAYIIDAIFCLYFYALKLCSHVCTLQKSFFDLGLFKLKGYELVQVGAGGGGGLNGNGLAPTVQDL